MNFYDLVKERQYKTKHVEKHGYPENEQKEGFDNDLKSRIKFCFKIVFEKSFFWDNVVIPNDNIFWLKKEVNEALKVNAEYFLKIQELEEQIKKDKEFKKSTKELVKKITGENND